ncbi:hypothetical protein ACWDQL_23640 [Streptomyces olivaceus]
MVVCWCAQLAGRFWGPLVLQPFLLHVFTSTDLPPPSYLGTIARRRLAYAGGAVLVAAGTAAYLTTDLFDRPGDAAQGLAVVVGLGSLTAPAWRWGQVRPVRDSLGAAAGRTASAFFSRCWAARAACGSWQGCWRPGRRSSGGRPSVRSRRWT